METLARLVGWGCAVVLAVGFLGRWSQAADSLSILRPYAVLGCVLAWPWFAGRVRWGIAALAALGAASLLPAFVPQAPTAGPLVYSKNLKVDNRTLGAVMEDVLAVGPDVVLLQEVSEVTEPILGMLAPAYPHALRCRSGGRIDNAVLSRTPFAGEGRCTARRAAAAVPVEIGGAVAWIVSLHVPWPWPLPEGPPAEAQAVELIAALPGPVIVAGDFNQMPWSARARRLARAAEGRLRTGGRPSYVLKGLVPLPIDHVIAPYGATVETRPRLGSDHRGLVARVAWGAL